MDLYQFPSHSKENTVYLDAIWDQLKDQISPFLRVLCINGSIYRLMDDFGKWYIAKKFM